MTKEYHVVLKEFKDYQLEIENHGVVPLTVGIFSKILLEKYFEFLENKKIYVRS